MVGSALAVVLIGLISNSLNLQHITGEWQGIIFGLILLTAIVGRELRERRTRTG